MNMLYCLDVLVLEGYVDSLKTSYGPHDLPPGFSENRYRWVGLQRLRERTRPGDVSPVRVVKTHCLPAFFPQGTRAVFLYRDARDAVWSYYHYALGWESFKGSFCDFLSSPSYCPVEAWIGHMRSWMPLAQEGHVLALRYEDLLVDPLNGLSVLCEFLAIDRSRSHLLAAIETCSLENLRAGSREENGATLLDPHGRAGALSRFFRSGKARQWVDAYGSRELAHIMDRAAPTLADYGFLSWP